MFRSRQLDRVRQIFADQFTMEGGRLVYRKGLKDAPIPVSEVERDRFVRSFNKRLTRLFWGAIAGSFVLIAVVVSASVALDVEISDLVMFALVVAPIAAAAPFWNRAWSAPARELSARTPTGIALEREAVRRLALRSVTWSQLLTATFVPAVILWQVSRDYDLNYGWNRLWLVGAGAFWALAAAQAYRKWLAGRN